MPPRYEFFEHTADIGAHIYGATLEDLFRNAATALYDALGKFELANPVAMRSVKLSAHSLEDLLHDWLTELLYDLEAHHALYDQIELTEITPSALTAKLRGGTIDFARAQSNEEIKAVTYHQLRVEQLADGTWRATVIFDV